MVATASQLRAAGIYVPAHIPDYQSMDPAQTAVLVDEVLLTARVLPHQTSWVLHRDSQIMREGLVANLSELRQLELTTGAHAVVLESHALTAEQLSYASKHGWQISVPA